MKDVRTETAYWKLMRALAEWRVITFTDTNQKEPTHLQLDHAARKLRIAYDEYQECVSKEEDIARHMTGDPR